MASIDFLDRIQSQVKVVPAQTAPLSITNAAVATKVDISAVGLTEGLYKEYTSFAALESELTPITGTEHLIAWAEAFFSQLTLDAEHIVYVIYCDTSVTTPFVSTAVIAAKIDIKLKTGNDFFGLGLDDFDTIFNFDTPGGHDYFLANLNDLNAKLAPTADSSAGEIFLCYQSSHNVEIEKAAAAEDATSIYAQIAAQNYVSNFWVSNVLFPTDASITTPPGRIDGAILGFGASLSLTDLAQFSFDGRTFSGVGDGFPVKGNATWPFGYGPLAGTTTVVNITNNNNNVYALAEGRSQLALGRLNLEKANVVAQADIYIDHFLMDYLNVILSTKFTPAEIPFTSDGATYVQGVIQTTLRRLVSANAINPDFSVIPNPAQSYTGDEGRLGPYTIKFSTAGRVHTIVFDGIQRT